MWTSVDDPVPLASGTLVVPRKVPALMSAKEPLWVTMMLVPGVITKVVGAPWTVMVRLVAEAAVTTPGVSLGWASADAGAADAAGSAEDAGADASWAEFFWHPARAAAAHIAAPAQINALDMIILPI